MILDAITETIAHFIGLFQMSTEQARAHKDFLQFEATKAIQQADPELKHVDVHLRVAHELVDYDPGMHYQAPGPQWVWAVPQTATDFEPPYVSVPLTQHHHIHAAERDHADVVSAATSGARVVHDIDPPGSLVDIIHQDIRLNDDDFVSIGDHGLKFTGVEGTGTDLQTLLNQAGQFDPLAHVPMPGNEAEAAKFIVDADAAIKALAAAEVADGSGDGVFVATGDTLEGTFVNGQLVTEAPKLVDHIPDAPAAAIGIEPLQLQSIAQSSTTVDVSVAVHAGGNTLMNTAFINDSWLSSTVMAVVGNHVEVNAVIQTNVWSDVDAVGASVEGWKLDPNQVTQNFNIAAFTHIDPTADAPAATADIGDFPKNWAVTVVQGDVLTMNWVQQFSFVTDNDVHVLSATGAKTTVTTGENVIGNDVSLHDFGSYYDLIVVGGSVYDGNYIQQMNVLLDDDLVGGVSGFHTSGQGSLSTSGNLLWNEASITSIGSNNFDKLPDAYRQMAEDFASGTHTVPLDVLNDPNFLGLTGLRVLYITGNLVDLQYIKQVNVLGDSDQVALAMNKTADSFPDGNWDVSTGSNALINVAQIVDADTAAKTYVGGDHYSDEILIQAGLVSSDPQFGTHSPDQLVNEAVAFLTDDDHAVAPQIDDPTHMHTTHDSIPVDPMQTVVS